MPVIAAVGVWAAANAGLIAGVSAVAGIASAGVSAYSARQAGKAQEAQSNYQAQVANQQAVLAQRNAEENSRLTQSQAMSDTQQLQRKYALVSGAAKAARAASGLGGGGATEGDIATDTFKNQTADEQMIRYNADLKSWDLNRSAGMEVWGLGNQSNMLRIQGKEAVRAGNMGAASSILQGASSVGMAYAKYKGY